MRILTLALLLGFWLPPTIIGWWFGSHVARGRSSAVTAIIVITTAVIWSLIWFVTNILLMPPYVRKGPSDPADAPVYVAIGFMALAFWVILPGSAFACWVGVRCSRRDLEAKLRGE